MPVDRQPARRWPPGETLPAAPGAAPLRRRHTAVEPAYKPNYRRIDVTVQSVSTVGYDNGYSDNVVYVTGWDGEPEHCNSALGPPRTTPRQPR